jgi:hypothetical protein
MTGPLLATFLTGLFIVVSYMLARSAPGGRANVLSQINGAESRNQNQES